MQAYLAEKYMSGPKADAILARAAPKKLKKKRKAQDTPDGAASGMVVDDDGGWGTAKPGKTNNNEEEDEGNAYDVSHAVVASDRGFKKRRKEESNWTTIRGEPSPPPENPEDKPMVVDDDDRSGADKPKMTGGLLSGDQIKKHFAPKELPKQSAEEAEMAQETIYRDSSGRKIDTKAARADAARKKREHEEREAAKMEWGKGLVQREEKEKRRKELEDARSQPFSRRADDESLNEDLKAKDRWNDPAAKFVTTTKKKGPRRPEYAGPTPPPNRFGIKPGYRWDGVDRGNGFEKKWFQASNARGRNKLESYQWGAEDM